MNMKSSHAAKGLRVLIIRHAYKQDAGGAEQYALNLAVALKKAGHKPLLVTNISEIRGKAAAAGIPARGGPRHKSQAWDRWYYLRYPLYTLWYSWLILSRRIDVVHPQSRDDFVFATQAARLLGKPVIWTDHADLKYTLDNVNHYNPRMRGWLIKAARAARAIVCVSSSEAKAVQAVAPELPELAVVHSGVFLPENIKPVAKTNELVVGTNARLQATKGIGELIEGFAALKRQDVDLWLVGGTSGNQATYEKMVDKLGVKEQVKFIGYVNNPNDYVAAMDIFVHGSYHEAFSLAIIEAAMLGRPIIATNVGGTPEIIDESCGILIEPKDPAAITKALQRLLDDQKLRDQIGQAVRTKARRDFDFQKIVETKIIPLYTGEAR